MRKERSSSKFSSQTGEKVDGELIQALVGQAFLTNRIFVENVAEQGSGAFLRIPPRLGSAIAPTGDFPEDRLNLLVRVPTRRLLFQDQIGAHAAARKVFHAKVILGAIGMSIKMTRPVVSDVFQELHEPKRGLEVRGTKTQVLVVAPWHLVVEVNMEKLARFPRLCHSMQEIQAGHLLVRDLGVDANHLWMIESGNEAEIMAGGGHVDIGARLIGFGFQREPEAVLSVDVVFAKIIDRFAKALHSLVWAATGIGFDAFAAAPQYKNLRAQLRTEIHRTHGLLQCVGAHLRIVCGKGTVTKNGVKKQRHRGHRNNEFVFETGFFECAHNSVAFRRSGVDGHQVVVMKIDAPGAHFAEHGNDLDGGNDQANEIAEWIAPPVPDRPEPERKLVFGFRLVSVMVRHGFPPWFRSIHLRGENGFHRWIDL